MIYVHQLDPVAINVFGLLQIRWYGLMYLFALLIAWCLGRARLDRFGITKIQFWDLLSYVACGLLVGGRVGYVAIYGWSDFISRPFSLVEVWQGGMAFHGGLVGGVLGMWAFARSHKLSFASLVVLTTPLIPQGLLFGRLGNFINAELVGRPTSLPWGVVFPSVDTLVRHPSQLYEMFGEGIVLWWLVMYYDRYQKHDEYSAWRYCAFFSFWYGAIRCFLELFREPDAHIGYLLWGLTMGQVLCFIMMLIAITIWLGILFFKQGEANAPRYGAHNVSFIE